MFEQRRVTNYRSEGSALTGYVVPGCVEVGAWMLWGNSFAAAAVPARSFLDNFVKQVVIFSHFIRTTSILGQLSFSMSFSPRSDRWTRTRRQELFRFMFI